MKNLIFIPAYFGVGLSLIIMGFVLSSGLYYGLVNIEYTPYEEGAEYVRIRAETKPQWFWKEPRNYHYDTVTFYIGFNNRIAQGDLVKGIWTQGTNTGPLDAIGMTRLINPKSPLSKEYSSQLHSILVNLKELHVGRFYHPRHHTYYFETPVKFSCQHFSLGANYGGLAYLGWIVIWPIYLSICFLFNRKEYFPPTIVYWIIFSCMAVLNILLVMMVREHPPQPISEILKYGLSFVNFPILNRMEMGRGRSLLIGLLIGPLLWGAIVSGMVIFIRDLKTKRKNNNDAGRTVSTEPVGHS